MRLFLISAFLFLSLSACLEEIKLDSLQTEERLVVEGILTDRSKFSSLKITLSDKPGAPKKNLPASGLIVEIRSSSGDVQRLRPDPLGTGSYFPENGLLIGEPGKSYSLYIRTSSGKEYLSKPQLMSLPVAIERLDYKVVKDPRPGLQIYTLTKDPAATTNYYRYTAEGFYIRNSIGVKVGFGDNYCCNTCWIRETAASLNIISDKIYNGKNLPENNSIFLPYFGNNFFQARVFQYSMSKEAFDFYQKIGVQLNRSGSIFDPLPAAVKGNLINSSDTNDFCLGFFEVSGVSSQNLKITEDGLNSFNTFYKSSIYVPDGDCMLRFPYSFYFSRPELSLF